MVAPKIAHGSLPSMTDLAALSAAGFEPPTGRALGELVDELTEALSSPDPVLRDEQAYPVLTDWILDGRLDGELTALGEVLHLAFPHQA